MSPEIPKVSIISKSLNLQFKNFQIQKISRTFAFFFVDLANILSHLANILADFADIADSADILSDVANAFFADLVNNLANHMNACLLTLK
jgi:phage-related protein